MSVQLSSKQIAKKYNLNEEDSQLFLRIVVNHLAQVCAAGSFLDNKDTTLKREIAEKEEEWDTLLASASLAVLRVIEDYLRQEIVLLETQQKK